MRHLLIAFLLAGLLLAGIPQTARAAPAEQACIGGAFRVDDMAGWYVSQPELMRVDVESCGGVRVVWDNGYGRHQAIYGAVDRLQGGGIVAVGITPDVWGFLDGQTSIGLKPAEPGWIQLITVSPYVTNVRVYRLQQMR